MVKRGKGKLRTALANHALRSKQRQQEKQNAERELKPAKRKTVSPRSRRRVAPFQRDDTVLLVGEGNFSFTLALLSAPHHHPPHQVLATSFDTEDEVYAKYPDAREIVARIRELAGSHAAQILAFGVDAGALHKCAAVSGTRGDDTRRWSKVWFGFPHAGAGHKDEQRNVLSNQLLLLRFLVSVAPFLTQGPAPVYVTGKKHRAANSDDSDDSDDGGGGDDEAVPPPFDAADATTWRPLEPPPRQGSVLITLRNTTPYTLWNVPMLGRRLRAVLPAIAAAAPPLPRGMHAPTLADVDRAGAAYQVWRSFEFVPDDWPGYSHRRTVGFIEGLSTSQNEDLLRRTSAPAAPGRHVGTGECRTYELALTK